VITIFVKKLAAKHVDKLEPNQPSHQNSLRSVYSWLVWLLILF